MSRTQYAHNFVRTLKMQQKELIICSEFKLKKSASSKYFYLFYQENNSANHVVVQPL